MSKGVVPDGERIRPLASTGVVVALTGVVVLAFRTAAADESLNAGTAGEP